MPQSVFTRNRSFEQLILPGGGSGGVLEVPFNTHTEEPSSNIFLILNEGSQLDLKGSQEFVE